ncbi:MAG TPA: Rieske (2Fe-2S) protein [Balneolaceae bacterium]|nr:Rieske (2Fe-2S) protein [Balneolaceae bacterium]
MDRRKFLTRLSIGLSSLIAALIAVPVVGSLIAPFFTEKPRVWRDIGPIDKFKIGETSLVKFEDATNRSWSGPTSKTGAWLRRQDKKKFKVFSINCTHLGCPVRWIKGSKIFLCPCHGGVYYEDGSRAAGPPPTGLSQYPVRVNKGRVQILTSPIPITNILGENQL